jgi:hypothetical protein
VEKCLFVYLLTSQEQVAWIPYLIAKMSVAGCFLVVFTDARENAILIPVVIV